jgi:hypothetical protein
MLVRHELRKGSRLLCQLVQGPVLDDATIGYDINAVCVIVTIILKFLCLTSHL